MDVSVIIVNYRTKELCADCINSIFEKTEGLQYEIILVDNNSADGSAAFLREKFGDRIRVVENDVNAGFARANNLGFTYATGRYVFLLNSDTVLINNAIGILAGFLDDNKDAGIVGGNLYDRQGGAMHSYMREFPSLENDGIPNIFARVFRRLNFAKNGREFNCGTQPVRVGYVTGADMMIRRSALDAAGVFDSEFFMYSEEVELTARIVKCGFSVWSVPSAKITHLEGASSGKKLCLNTFKEGNWLNGKCLFYEKVYGRDSVAKFLKKHVFCCRRAILHDVILLQFARLETDKYRLKLAKQYLTEVKRGQEPYRG